VLPHFVAPVRLLCIHQVLYYARTENAKLAKPAQAIQMIVRELRVGQWKAEIKLFE